MQKQEKSNYQGFKLATVLIIIAVTSIVSALTTGIIMYNNSKITNKVSYSDLSKDEELNQFLEVYASIISEYYEDINKEELLEKAIAAMLNYLGDDYTTYMDEEETKELATKLSGEYQGIGISVKSNETNIKEITEVFENTPASRAGILPGDIIVGYNNNDVNAKSSEEVINLIKANKETFTLKLKRGEEFIIVTLKNENIIYPSISYKVIENTSIGYIQISTFSKTLEEQMKKALTKLENAGITSLIIDVRDNTGGYLDAANAVASKFLEEGKRIYSLNYKDEITHYTDKTKEHREYPIVVLVNEHTASAAEILAAALKDSYGATLVGNTTYGKGKVQQTKDLNTGTMIKYTSALWLVPSGGCIDKVGLKPDYLVTNEYIEDENGHLILKSDAQLEKALSLLENS